MTKLRLSTKPTSSLRKRDDSSSPSGRKKIPRKVVGFGPPTLISIPSYSSSLLQSPTHTLLENPLLWASMGWCLTSAALQSLQKFLLGEYSRPLTVVTVQLGVTSIAGLLSLLVRPGPPRRLKKRHWIQLGHAGAWNALGMVFWVLTLSAGPMSRAALWKTTQSSMMALLFPGASSLSVPGILAHVPWLGVAWDALRGDDVPYRAIIFGLASNLCFVGRSVASARLSQKRFAGASNLFTILCITSFCILLPITWVVEGVVDTSAFQSSLSIPLLDETFELPLYQWLAISGGLFWLSNELLFEVSDHARASVSSRQAVVWADTARRCFLFVVSHVVLGEALPNLWSLQLAVGSLTAYKLGQLQQNKQVGSGGDGRNRSDSYDILHSATRRGRFDSDGWSLANDSQGTLLAMAGRNSSR